MLNRFIIHICFALLFAASQIGIAAHQISHFHDASTQSQHDKNTPTEHCDQCIGHAHADHAIASAGFEFAQTTCTLAIARISVLTFVSLFSSTYHARAPPAFLS